MGLQEPLGETLRWHGRTFTVIGVIEDMVMESPYQPVSQTVFVLNGNPGNFINIKINPAVSAREALSSISAVFKKYNPAAPFEYKFVAEEYARKFGDEQRIGRLATGFAALTIFISCLGIFGLASFTAEQRTKEIGVRKVLGASVLSIWQLLIGEFMRLVMIASLIAVPAGYYLLQHWLRQYEYRTSFSWWVFALASGGVLLITLLTVSSQAIKAALSDPVKSLRNE